ncbi:hypothetical protein BABINDRAFT_164953 [Babjeviella inositovora NRRL Y-12698]|uniref:Xylose isomerase-like TIM barrel domain-containing protein n=1 Tax=Babjeviella inositovora NRRL Y-12698 TaxID=984486 RepID=A0A1E3QZZ5_9ASCO|nr:uncharacterized protein BABINDRAFT_164953 [Babjeviella inositovora NRRL Y-12698]ODQ83260.1 hypothetical protein BABINDRAFT_164953 [Babjeviella inositovora NRRL Y-12698]
MISTNIQSLAYRDVATFQVGSKSQSAAQTLIPLIQHHETATLQSLVPYKMSIATICLAPVGTIFEKLDFIASAGFQGVEIMVPDLEQATPAEIYRKCQTLNLEITIWQPFRDFEGQPTEERFQAKITDFSATLDIMDELHTDLVLLCTNGQADAVYDFNTYVLQLRLAADMAAKRGKRIAYEALCWGTHIFTLQHLWDIIKAVDRPNFGICLDSFHIFSRKCDIECCDEMNEKIFFVQLCDAPILAIPEYLRYSRNYRTMPCQGDFPNLTLLHKIYSKGYNGYLSLEVFNEALRNSGDNKAIADDALRGLLLLQAEYMSLYHSETYFPDPVSVKGLEIEGSVVSVAQTSSLEELATHNFIVADSEAVSARLQLLAYANHAIHLSEGSENHLLKRLNITCESRFEFNRMILYLRGVFGFDVLQRDACNIYNNFGLPYSLSFGAKKRDNDGLVINISTDCALGGYKI